MSNWSFCVTEGRQESWCQHGEWLSGKKLDLRNIWRWLENLGTTSKSQGISRNSLSYRRMWIGVNLIASQSPDASPLQTLHLWYSNHWLVDLHWEVIRYLQTLKINYFPMLSIVRFCMVSVRTCVQVPSGISWQATGSKHNLCSSDKKQISKFSPTHPFCDSPFWINKQAHGRESHVSLKLTLLLPAAGEWSVVNRYLVNQPVASSANGGQLPGSF